MADKTAIEWTDATWNPIVGCSIVSKGCTNCYAMNVAGSRTSHTAKYQGLTAGSKRQPVWTGEVRFWEKALLDPLKWREPRRVFVNSMGDLLHENAPDEWIDRCFAVMALAPHHTFQILTKRPERMRDYLAHDDRSELIGMALGNMLDGDWIWNAGKAHRDTIEGLISLSHGMAPDDQAFAREEFLPLPNVWLGVSCEDQATADERIPLLLDTPAAIRFISAEPLLGPIDLKRLSTHGGWYDALQGWRDVRQSPAPEGILDWVIVGGESGPHARPMHPAWARSLRDQCTAAGVPFFFKQWGEWAPAPPISADDSYAAHRARGARDLVVWPDSTGEASELVGKKRAGALLGGREWREFPVRS